MKRPFTLHPSHLTLALLLTSNLSFAASCSNSEKLNLIKLGLSPDEIKSTCAPATSNAGQTPAAIVPGTAQPIYINVNNNSTNNANATNTQTNNQIQGNFHNREKFFWQFGLGMFNYELEKYRDGWDADSQLALDAFSMVYFPSYLEKGNFGFGLHWLMPQPREFNSETDTSTTTATAIVNQYGVEIMYDIFTTGKNGFHVLPLIDIGKTTTDGEILKVTQNSNYSYSSGYSTPSYEYETISESQTYIGYGVELISDDVNTGTGWYAKAVIGSVAPAEGSTESSAFSRFSVGIMW